MKQHFGQAAPNQSLKPIDYHVVIWVIRLARKS